MSNTQLALVDHLTKNRSLSAQFTHQRRDKTFVFKTECNHALTIVRGNAKLRAATPESVGQCVLDAGILGVTLNPVLKQAYLIPYKNNSTGVTNCTISVSYMGMEQVAYRTGMVANIQTGIVHKNDHFKVFVADNKRQIEHVEANSNRGPCTHAYCIATYTNGSCHVEVMDKAQIIACRDAAAKKNNNSIPFTWNQNNPFRYEMYKKSVLRRAWKHFPKSDNPEFERVISAIDRTDPLDFAPQPEKKESAGTASMTVTSEMLDELCGMMEKAGIPANVYDRWLKGLARSMGYKTESAIKVEDFDKAKASMAEGLASYAKRNTQGNEDE